MIKEKIPSEFHVDQKSNLTVKATDPFFDSAYRY